MSGIKVIQLSSHEVQNYRENMYQRFLKYYLETNLPVTEIYKILGLPNKNSNVKYIRNRLKEDGYDTLKRMWSIKKGEWLR